MAVVRFSDELKSAIITNAKDMFRASIDAARKLPPTDITAEDVYTQVFGQWSGHMMALPPVFFKWYDTFHVATVNGKSLGFDFKLIQKQPFPPELPKGGAASYESSYAINLRINDYDNPLFQKLAEVAQVRLDAIKAADARRDEFVDGVKKVIEAHTTLAPALKAWPPLWDLVPETFKDRHRKVVVREKNTAEIDGSVDLSKLTAAVTFAKLTR